jgi:hypothetical protein
LLWLATRETLDFNSDNLIDFKLHYNYFKLKRLKILFKDL